MKIAVYTICKNESAFVNRWVDSMSEADGIYVLDTGSEDDTVEKLKKRGVVVDTAKIVPWRFDTARNMSLELVPEDVDVCVCTDLDEVFLPGWRERIEKTWKKGDSQARFRYTWSFNEDGSEGVVFWEENIHARKGFRWTHPVHEVLEITDPSISRNVITIEGIQLNHYPDKNKSRSQYLGLLEMSVEESPDDDRNMHYLGREYMFKRRWDDCIRTLERHLAMPSAVWKDERSASMRYIANSYYMKGNAAAARDWYLKAIAEAPHLREPYMDLALMLFREKEWDGVLYFTECALKIKVRPASYICEAASWGSLPNDLRAIALYNTGRIEDALDEAKTAVEKEPKNERLKNNVKLIEDSLNNKKIRRS